ncbi:hypothetical protein CRV08_00920 [Halarcobacter ebronensis]|uniref:histidine kinase n=1 Tax=Halarcobacter ebronensis TaxID=1462615 RepID=A0A4V1LS19_9BACT|nr:7TM diverse intracellular signaling domain-containing protein [Halarcobacter ebronensis]RXJ70158.1 hypothetical protein CRV08_00920 [Halarcobacter ebronensis]
MKKSIFLILIFINTLSGIDITIPKISIFKEIDMSKEINSITQAINMPNSFKTERAFTRILRRNESNDNLWLRIQLVNDSDSPINKIWLTRWERSHFELYLVDENKKILSKDIIDSNDFLKQSSIITIPKKSKRTLYIQVKAKKGLDQFNYMYFVDAHLAKQFLLDTERLYHHGLFFGILLSMTLYSLFTFFIVKEKAYLYLGLYQAWVVIATSDAWQYFYRLLENVPTIAHILLNDLYAYSMMVFSIIFTKAFLNTKEKMPRIDTFLNLSIILSLPLDLMRGPVYYGAFGEIILIVIGFYAAYKGNIASLIYAFGFLGFVSYYALVNLSRLLGWDFYLEFTNAKQIFTCIEGFIFSLAIYLKLKEIMKEKILAQEISFKYEKMILEQSRFAAMGEMIAAIAHQWRQPLNHLNLIFNNILLADKSNKLTSKYLEKKSLEAEGQLQFMSTTIDDFTNFFAIKQKKETFTLKEACQYSINLLDSRIKKERVEVAVRTVYDMQYTNYKNELIQTLTIILNNSLDAFLSVNESKKRVTITILKNKLSIEDNAGGIKEDILLKIFDPYFSTKSKKFGTGLGLYMAKKIVQDLIRGSIYAENTTKGCKFIIQFHNE